MFTRVSTVLLFLFFLSMKNYISINIIYLRKINYLNRKDLAKKYGLTYSAIGTYETDKATPPISFLQKLCKEYNFNLDDFVNKNLSKLNKTEGYVQEPKTPYEIIEQKTEFAYAKMVKVLEDMIVCKNEMLEKKEIEIKRLTNLLNGKNE